jgi:PAS domain-containing protein
MGRDTRRGELRRTAELAVSVLGSLSETSVVGFDSELRCVEMAGGLPASEFDRLTEHCRAALAGERRRFEHADGTRMYDFDVAPIEEDGVIVGGLVVGRDITDRKRMERTLAHRARDYRDLAEQASDVLSRSDEHAVYTYVSPSAARLYGFEPEVVGLQSSARDITDRTAASDQFRMAFDDALIGIALVAPDGSWLRVNEALAASSDARATISTA